MYRYNEIKETLLSEIKQMKPNTKIQSRPKLCKKYGVTRTTVDRAIKELINEKLLYSINGSGTYAAPPQIPVWQAKKPGDPLNWCIILPDVMYDLYTAIVRGISDVASRENINIMLFNTDNDIVRQHSIVSNIVKSGSDGLIIIPAISNDIMPDTFSLLQEAGIPFVFCNRGIDTLPAVPLVCSNGFYGGYISVKHLIENGYRHIAFLARLRYRVTLERYFGYFAALSEAGIPLDRKLVVLSFDGNDQEGAYDITMRLLERYPKIDSIFSSNDQFIPGIYEAITSRGLRISDDVGVISHDNSMICERVTPKTTSATFKSYEAGYQAALILRKLMYGEVMENLNLYVLQPELVVRNSCRGIMPSD